jgi:hypothetical protein
MNPSRLLNILIFFIALVFITAASAETSENAKPVETKAGASMHFNRINLQNTPSVPGVTSRDLSFDSNGIKLKGTLYTPTGADGPFPGVVVAGAWTTVKEQMAGTYARELAARGFAALAFDFTGWGASGGDIRYKEDPATKTNDIMAAAAFMSGLKEVDTNRIYGIGICASSGYMAAAVADSPHLSKLALVAAWLHDPKMAEAVYGGPESVAKLVTASRAAEKSPKPQLIIAASATDDASLMYQAPYYTEEDRGLIVAYDNKFNLASWEPWLTYNAQASADRLTAPTLIICSEAAALPAGAHAFVKRTKATVKEIWLDNVNQFDFYDRADIVKLSAAAIAQHFGLGGRLSDDQEIANTIARYFAAVDQQDWNGAKTLMTNPFHLDYASFGGGDPANLDPADILAGWSGFLPGFDHTHHQLGNLDIEVFGDTARVACYVTASHIIDDRVWTVVGTYNNSLIREADRWKLSGSQLLFKYQTGDTNLPAEAQQRMANRNVNEQ